MRRRTKFIIGLMAVMAAFAAVTIYMNYAKVMEFFSTFLAPNAVTITIVAAAVLIGLPIIYKLGEMYDWKFDFWRRKKLLGGALLTRDKARETSKKTLELEYLLETGLIQMHRRQLSLVCDAVVDTEKERKPFAVFVWTTLPFQGRKHDLARTIENNFDQVFIVEVDLVTGYPAVSGLGQKETLEWLVRKHILSRPKEEDIFKKTLQEKMMEGFGFGMGEAAAVKEKPEEKGRKESEKE